MYGTGQIGFPGRNHLVDDAVFAADVVRAGLAARDMVNERRKKIAAMTPPERESFRRRMPLRVAKRVGWAALWVGLLMLVFDAHLPGILGTLVFIGLPLGLFTGAVMKSRRFWAGRARAWDGWFRSRGSSLREVQDWWSSPDTTYEERQEFVNVWGMGAAL
jgi:hypothetical protein